MPPLIAIKSILQTLAVDSDKEETLGMYSRRVLHLWPSHRRYLQLQ